MIFQLNTSVVPISVRHLLQGSEVMWWYTLYQCKKIFFIFLVKNLMSSMDSVMSKCSGGSYYLYFLYVMVTVLYFCFQKFTYQNCSNSVRKLEFVKLKIWNLSVSFEA